MKLQLLVRIILLCGVIPALGLTGCGLKAKNRKSERQVVDYSGSYTFYFPSMEYANWHVISGPLSCSLTQEIPAYGHAQFIHKPLQGMTFSMKVLRPPKHPANARLISRTPTWREKNEIDRDLGTIPLVASDTPFYLHNGWARRLLLELERGMNPLFRYSDWADGRDQVNVMLSSINFMPAWESFQKCEQGLLKYVFADVKKSVFQYDVNQTKPGKDALARLDQLSEYIKLDPTIKRIKIDGYTDSKGFSRINITVAKKRIKVVKQYLIAQGVSKALIHATAHRENEARFNNRTAEGRRKNRRVEIKLLK
jgi:outer membrane protein OmpA-like peptidoglycan-associated protein